MLTSSSHSFHMRSFFGAPRRPLTVVSLLVLFLLVADRALCVVELAEIHRIVAIGDIHGDAENFLTVLRAAEVVENVEDDATDILANPPRWKPSSAPNASVKLHTTLVQMGDLVDRGEQDYESLNIAIGLQEQLKDAATDDAVVLLIGNHELLNLQGYYHYVNKKNYGGFLSKPLRVEGMQPGGAFGKYIVDNFKTAFLAERTLFVHAGIEAEMNITDVELLNNEVAVALRQRNFRHRFLRSDGPLWTRKMIQDSMMDECKEVEEILERLNADRIVVGHTPQHGGRIEQYCGGHVLAIDVGISRWMYNKVAALEMLFLKYADTETGQATTKFIIREIREASPSAAASKAGGKKRKSARKRSSAHDNHDEGDL